MGRQISTAPTDLVAYQEIIAQHRPDVIVETGAGDASRSLFLATIAEMVGHGTVLAIGAGDDRPRHPRLRYLDVDLQGPDGEAQVAEAVGDGSAMVVIGSRTDRERVHREMVRLAPLVSVGSYLVVTDTVLNGHPVAPAFGAGPAEAVRQLLLTHGEFVADPAMEKYSLTFNPGGFLRRMR
jgi:cephalosporin hydroxylase